MTNEQIEAIAAFMYSSASSSDVPFRLSLTFGMSGAELSRQEFVALMQFLRDEEPTKENFARFLADHYEG